VSAGFLLVQGIRSLFCWGRALFRSPRPRLHPMIRLQIRTWPALTLHASPPSGRGLPLAARDGPAPCSSCTGLRRTASRLVTAKSGPATLLQAAR